ncbi:uncharacterized protein C2orf15 homolog isoform X2 [Arvicanthis niloticus]|uniref:uncharacterized protein C2orf15 homolog isoform X2 n=1 Tax=Arvicanthis niloticus TaxID=61156 RepID=UPI00148657E3|nr:uncharacterized protein C2orf15 homolog [Arvicanthis niloticus]
MGFLLSKAAIRSPAAPIDPEASDHLTQGAEKSRVEPVTRLFQDTKKIKLEDINQANVTGKEGTDPRWSPMGFVKENDGLVMTDLE